jgi:hypothetical protein
MEVGMIQRTFFRMGPSGHITWKKILKSPYLENKFQVSTCCKNIEGIQKDSIFFSYNFVTKIG